MDRRPSGKVVLAGVGALLAAAAVGLAVLLGGSDAGLLQDTVASVETGPGRTETAPNVPSETVPEAEPGAPEPAPPPETTAPSETTPSEGSNEGARQTRFPEERVKDPDKRGKSFTVPPAHRFSGTGNTLIGTVDVREPSIVKWKTRGSFEVQFGREAFPIIAPQRSGELIVPPYKLELVRVLADTSWTITIRPQRAN